MKYFRFYWALILCRFYGLKPLEKVIAQYPDEELFHFFLGREYFRRKRYEYTVRHWEKCDGFRGVQTFLINLSMAHFCAGNHRACLEYVEQAQQVEPSYLDREQKEWLEKFRVWKEQGEGKE